MFPADTLANYRGKFCIDDWANSSPEKIWSFMSIVKFNLDETKDLNHGVNNLLQHFYTFTIFLPMAGSK